MRPHDSHAPGAARREATARGPVPAAPTPNVRVPPAPPQPPASPQALAPLQSAAVHGGWDCDVEQDEAAGRDENASPDTVRRSGRPRSERAEQAILDATIAAIGERGIEGVRCEDVAARAGVGKATLYRRWPGKEDLLIAAFAAMRRPLPKPAGASVRDDLITLLTVVAADADDPRYSQQYALLHGAGERYPRLVAGYRERVIEPRRESIRVVLRRGIERGELRLDTNVEVAMLLLTGAVLARGKHEPTPAAPGFVDSAVDELLRGIATPAAVRPPANELTARPLTPTPPPVPNRAASPASGW